MKYWWAHNFARIAEEKETIEKLAATEGWFSIQKWHFHHGALSVLGSIQACGFDYPVRLVFPDQYPEVPAWVEPQDPESRWTNHQYGNGGPLCLELRPDNWSPQAMGADVLRSAFNLLSIENPKGPTDKQAIAESAHNVGDIQSYAWLLQPILTAC